MMSRQPLPERPDCHARRTLGLTLTNTGEIEDVRWNGPAFKAGVSSGATLVAVNGHEEKK